MSEKTISNRRFKVALSFPGEKRDYIKQVAESLVKVTGKDSIFYDNYFEDELAIPDSDILLMDMYKNHSELVAVFLCKEYSEKEWCGLEWSAIRDMIRQKRHSAIMFFRFDNTPINGMLGIYGYVDINGRPPSVITELILKRLEKNSSIPQQEMTEYVVPALHLPENSHVSMLEEIKLKIDQLLLQQNKDDSPILQRQIDVLTEEKELLRKQLLQSETIIEQQEVTRKELEALLSAEKDKVALKREALSAVKERNYDKAEILLKDAAAERIQELSDDFYQLGKINELRLDYREALRYYELATNIQPDNEEYVFKAGEIADMLGLYNKSLEFYQKSLTLAIKKFGNYSKEVASVYAAVGIVYYTLSNYEQALEYYTNGLSIRESILGKEHLETSHSYNNIGFVYLDKGEYGKALEYFKKAATILEKILGKKHQDTATAYDNMGSTYLNMGNSDVALKYCKKAISIRKLLLGNEHPETANSYNNIGRIYIKKGNFEQALKYFSKALIVFEKIWGKQHPYTATCYANLGMVYMNKGDHDRALEYFNKDKLICEAVFGTQHYDTAMCYSNIADVWHIKGQKLIAIEFGKKAYDIDIHQLGDSHPNTILHKEKLYGYGYNNDK